MREIAQGRVCHECRMIRILLNPTRATRAGERG